MPASRSALRGPFNLVRAVVPGMVERGAGRVLDLNSGAGAADRAVLSAYGASKAALFRLTGNLHLAGHDRGLRAFEVAPGTVRTGMTESMPMHAGRTEWTPPQRVSDLVLAIAAGELDAWSGCFLHAGIDTAASLRAAAGSAPDDRAVRPGLAGLPRRLAVTPWGADDVLGRDP